MGHHEGLYPVPYGYQDHTPDISAGTKMDKTPVQKMYFHPGLASKYRVSSFIHSFIHLFVHSFTLRIHYTPQEWRGTPNQIKHSQKSSRKGLTTAKGCQGGRDPVWRERAKHGLRSRRGYSRAAHTHSVAHHRQPLGS